MAEPHSTHALGNTGVKYGSYLAVLDLSANEMCGADGVVKLGG